MAQVDEWNFAFTGFLKVVTQLVVLKVLEGNFGDPSILRLLIHYYLLE